MSCAGCFQIDSTLKIDDNGAVIMKNKILGDPYIAGIIEEAKNSITKNYPNAKINPASEGDYTGYEIEMFFQSIEEFAANNFELFQARPGKCNGIQISNGWFYNSYTFDLLIERSRDIDRADLSMAFAQSLLAQGKFDLIMELPNAAEISNADYMSNDGKILRWNLAPALIHGQNKNVQVNFRIYNNVRIAATFFLALIIVAGIIYNLSQSKQRKNKLDQDNFQNK